MRIATRNAAVLGVAVLGIGVLGAATLGGTALLSEPDPIAGQAQRAPAALPDLNLPALGVGTQRRDTAPETPHPATAPSNAAPADQDAAPPPADDSGTGGGTSTAATGQRPGTIVLAEGGTASLVRAEVARNGTLPIPNGVDQATWWGVGLGARSGATVFAGHVNWAGATGPFAELWSASRGDRVAVVDANGRSWAFRVERVLTVSKHDLPKQAVRLFGPGGRHRAVLVTCGGRWVGGADGYESNRIVVATPT